MQHGDIFIKVYFNLCNSQQLYNPQLKVNGFYEQKSLNVMGLRV